MLSLKSGVRILGIRPESNLAIQICSSIFMDYGYDMEITSVMDGKHSSGSIHYSGGAFDVGVKKVPKEKRYHIFRDLRRACGEDFDVLHEFIGKPREHYHVEYQPKKGY